MSLCIENTVVGLAGAVILFMLCLHICCVISGEQLELRFQGSTKATLPSLWLSPAFSEHVVFHICKGLGLDILTSTQTSLRDYRINFSQSTGKRHANFK